MIHPYKVIWCNHKMITLTCRNLQHKVINMRENTRYKNSVNNILPLVYMHTQFAYTGIKFLWKDTL